MFNRLAERETVIETFKGENEEPNNLVDNSVPDRNIINNEIPNIKQAISNDNANNEMPIVGTSNYMIQYIEDNYESKQLHEQFLLENYPYKYDPEFWYNFLQKDISLTTDYRYIETSMVKRVVEINNNPLDKWLGITNTRLQNIFNIEQDFVVQYYALRHYWCFSSFCTILCDFISFCI